MDNLLFRTCCSHRDSYLQDDGAPDDVETSKDYIFVIILPVKQVVRHSKQSHRNQGKGEVLQEAKVERLALAVVPSDVIWRGNGDRSRCENWTGRASFTE